MVDFVLERKEYWRNKSMQENGNEMYCRSKHSTECEKYATFLRRPLERGMFDGENQLFRCELFHEAIICEGHNIESILKNCKTVEDLMFMLPYLNESVIKEFI
jgi:hypothetical protein